MGVDRPFATGIIWEEGTESSIHLKANLNMGGVGIGADRTHASEINSQWRSFGDGQEMGAIDAIHEYFYRARHDKQGLGKPFFSQGVGVDGAGPGDASADVDGGGVDLGKAEGAA